MRSMSDDKAGLERFQEFARQQAVRARAERAKEAPSVCPECGGTGYRRVMEQGYEVVHKCRCRRARDMKEALAEANIPPKFRTATLDPEPDDGSLDPFRPVKGEGPDFELARRSQKEALQRCRLLRDIYLTRFRKGESQDEIYGLLLYGASGLGKTRMVCALLGDLVRAGLTQVSFIEYTELFKKIRFSYDSDVLSYEGVFEPLLRAKVLVIDDFATQISGSNAWIIDNIGYIINERYVHKMPTLLTTNHWSSLQDQASGDQEHNLYEQSASWEANRAADHASRLAAQSQQAREVMEQRISQRLRSRIREMCMEIKVEGFDYRKRLGNIRDIHFQHAMRKRQG